MKQTIVIHVIDTDSMEIHSRLFNEDNSLREEVAEDIKTNELSDHYSLEDFERAFNRSKIDSNTTYILCEVKDVEEEIVQPEGLNYVTVPIVELASELAHNATVDECNNDGNDLFVEDSKDEVYTEIAQEVFNRWYDYYYNEIKNTTKKF